MLKVFKLVALSAVLAVSLNASSSYRVYVPYNSGAYTLNNMINQRGVLIKNYQYNNNRPSSLINRPCAYSRWGC